jgi:N-acetylglucosaminyldiphosphoundecaprenol N-acetyl-beta-D-mannosaminyltransferase
MSEDEPSYRTILGVRFFAGPADEAVQLGLRGGLVVVPSAPVLVTMVTDEETRAALLESKLALTDSGLMVLLWNLICRDDVKRVSGLEYLHLLLQQPALAEEGATFWIMPNEEAMRHCLAWLTKRGYPVQGDSFYLAPMYGGGAIHDDELLDTLLRLKPRHIFTAVGGGVQERLGLFLQRDLPFRPGIHCIGAAIGFLTGDQVHIPMWADAWRIGWLFRCLSAPHRFIPRYWKALRLIPLLLKYRDRMPVAKAPY